MRAPSDCTMKKSMVARISSATSRISAAITLRAWASCGVPPGTSPRLSRSATAISMCMALAMLLVSRPPPIVRLRMKRGTPASRTATVVSSEPMDTITSVPPVPPPSGTARIRASGAASMTVASSPASLRVAV